MYPGIVLRYRMGKKLGEPKRSTLPNADQMNADLVPFFLSHSYIAVYFRTPALLLNSKVKKKIIMIWICVY